MKNMLPPFTAAVDQIIQQELNDIQREQYAIEGTDLIDALFATNSPPEYDDETGFLCDYGISPTSLELQEAGITFSDVINACFSIVKDSTIRESVKMGQEADAYDNSTWEKAFATPTTSPVLTALLCDKYKNVILTIIQSA